ncbi:MAG: hypothetical protein OEV40_06670 [Acidimicrobiia bacterium]|nr:hypothetical protein [Acidimicrobiia bacterium]
MGVHVVAVYKPREGMETRLLAETEQHVPVLRRLGLATDTPSMVLRAPDGSLVEHFEWVSHEAIAQAHEHPEVASMWARYEECCTYGSLADLPNAGSLFAEFEHVGSY